MLKKLRPLFPYLRRYRSAMVWGALSVVLYNAAKVLIPKFIGQAVDAMTHGRGQHVVALYVIWLLAAAVAAGVFLYFQRWIIIGASREIEYDLRNDLFSNLERQPASFYHENRTGDIMARTTNDLSAVRQLLGPAIMYSANTIFFTAAALPFMWKISPRLTLFAFVPLPIASVLVQYMGRKIHQRFERIQAMFSDISSKAQENFSGARLVRAFAQEEAEIASFETANKEYISRALRLVRLMAMLWPTLEFVLGITLVLTLLVGGREVTQGRITAGDFAAYLVYMVQLTFPMIALGYVVNLFQRGTASVLRIEELLHVQPTIWDTPEAKTSPTTVHGDIEFRKLTFRYAKGPEVLRNISLHIPAGTSLAIVGPTGSGKSTLVHLIPRLLDADPGMVRIDGHPIREWKLDVLRRNIGFVPQETFLFSNSIHDNVTFGMETAKEEEVIRAAQTAHIATEILEFPQGFGTLVGERGVTLSGGQRQRTAIARALIRDPRILILDDALASVDTYTEDRILAGLREQMQGRTTIFISHRFSTAQHADRIAVLVDGRIAEYGTHEELLAKHGYYRGLYEKQQLEEEIAVEA
ncbi:MAG: ABC transporter ATP-binding protein [Acidobacteria bacterium]|nr:ABC transporter ATP-binding protein [Acidobacteriota bacterium]